MSHIPAVVEPTSPTLARARLILGIILVVAAPLFAIGTWYSTREPLETLAWFEAHRAPGDSSSYASAVYHAARARNTRDRRWTATGYATLGVFGSLLGAVLLIRPRPRRGA